MKISLEEPYKQFFGTLANQVRIDIIKHLRNGNSNVTEMIKKTGHEQSTISHSLKRLEECGFVTVIPNGKTRVYSINKKTVKPLFALMELHMNNYCKHVVQNRSDKNERKKVCH